MEGLSGENLIAAVLVVILGLILPYGLRSFAEGRADSFWLNAAFFSVIAELEIVARFAPARRVSVWTLSLFLVVLVAALACAWIYSQQRDTTAEHIRSVLRKHRHSQRDTGAHDRPDSGDAEVSATDPLDSWGNAGARTLGPDFYPEFFKGGFGHWLAGRINPREQARAEFAALLPPRDFSKVDPPELEVPEDERERLWRLFVLAGFTSVVTVAAHMLLVIAGVV